MPGTVSHSIDIGIGVVYELVKDYNMINVHLHVLVYMCNCILWWVLSRTVLLLIFAACGLAKN